LRDYRLLLFYFGALCPFFFFSKIGKMPSDDQRSSPSFAAKKFAMAKFFILSFFLLVFSFHLSGQTSPVDTTIALNVVLVTESRLPLSGIGSRWEQFDSNRLELLRNTNLAEALGWNNQLYVKNYGPGRLSTSSIRGAGGVHSAVLWNGFNLQSPMLGVIDLSLFPLHFIDEVRVEYGGGSALWGSGPVGGVIHLNSRVRFDQGWRLGWNGSLGSFGNHNHGLDMEYSDSRFINRTRAFAHTAQNDFPYHRPNGDKQNLPHSKMEQYGLLQENYFQITPRQQIGLHLWYQQADREIPPTTFEETSLADQSDEFVRALVDWKRSGDRIDWYARAAFFQEQLNYRNPTYFIDTDNRVRTAIGEVEARIRINARQELNVGINNTWARARSTNYEEEPEQNRAALFAAYQLRSRNGAWKSVLSARQELTGGEWSPFAPSLGVEGYLFENLSLKAAVSRNYRVPAFDDRFFIFGGNPDLKPEDGWTEELSLEYARVWSALDIKLGLTAFNRNVDNWIIWLPDENFFYSPRNILQVWSRGLESSFSSTFQFGQTRLGFNARYDYVRSTNEKARIEGDPSLGKQLVYVPEHKVLGQLELSRGGWYLALSHTFTGTVYTTDDHSASLPGFQLGQVILARSFSLAKITGRVFGKINNLWNESYEVVAAYPMPGRHYELGIRLDWLPN
jgi:vitamin B12 transporter